MDIKIIASVAGRKRRGAENKFCKIKYKALKEEFWTFMPVSSLAFMAFPVTAFLQLGFLSVFRT